MFKNLSFSIIVIYIFKIIFIANGQNIGQSCTVERTRSPGICKLIYDCQPVINDLTSGRRHHTRCSFKDKTEVVCCPSPKPTRATPKPLSINSRISEKKCDEYKSFVYEKEQQLIPLSTNSDRENILKDKCGRISIPLIVGGEDAKPREFPHMALIGFQTDANNPNLVQWPCNGALISDEYVLTAGHCLSTRDWGEAKYVRLGELNISSTDDDAKPEDFNISQIIPHPNYKRPSKYDDIALLKLDRKVKLDPYKRPICLPTEFDVPDDPLIASGWGHTQYGGKSSSQLQKVGLQKFTQTECNETYASIISRKFRDGLRSTQICAGSKSEVKDTCQGDSGGPLQVFHPSLYCMYTIVGITSFGIQCGVIGVPGIYTRVYSYIDWIESIVWPN